MERPSKLTWIASLPARLRLFAPVMRFALSADGDAWQGTEHPVPHWMFGRGCVKDFGWYLEGESRYAMADLQQVCRWLAACDYVSDQDLFRADDFWQHPNTFEQIRKGDCDDHALWAWRKLTRMGYDAEFLVGQWRIPDTLPGLHAWVRFVDGGRHFLLEGTGDDPEAMILPLAHAKQDYSPHFGVDGRLRRKVYRGFLDRLEARAPAPDSHERVPLGA